MADGYARACQRAGNMYGPVGGRGQPGRRPARPLPGAVSPVIAITGHRPLSHQYRNSYQEIEHFKPFASTTKYSVAVDTVEQLPHLLRQAFREATSGAPGPVHMDFMGIQGEVIENGEADLDVIIEEDFMKRSIAASRSPGPEQIRQARCRCWPSPAGR